MAAKESVYDSGWLPSRVVAYVVGKPLWWALEQLGIVGEDSGTGGTKESEWSGEYVVLRLVERAADAVIARQRGKAGAPGDCLYSLEGFRREFAEVVGGELSVVDTKVLVRFLERDRKIIVVNTNVRVLPSYARVNLDSYLCVQVIKFVDASTERREITAVDRGILELKSAVENMRAQVDSLQQKIEESAIAHLR
jgi:charged multivesicular body protein 7